MKAKRLYMLDLMKLFAILLVFNSHCDILYSNPLLATGGALGNALFFVICGYLTKIDSSFIKWFSKRLKRLYIPTIIVTTITCIIEKKIPINLIDFIQMFIWPTNYWFVGALIIFYPILYFLIKHDFIKKIKLYTVIIIIIYIVYYYLFVNHNVWSVEEPGLLSVQSLFKLIYYFYIFSIGYYLKNSSIIKNNRINEILKVFLILFVYFIIKLLLYKNYIPMFMQFLTQLCGVFFAIECIKFSIRYENKFKIPRIITQISNLSFEMYLCQFIIIKYSEKIVFPINIINALFCTIIMSILLKKIENTLIKKVNANEKKCMYNYLV